MTTEQLLDAICAQCELLRCEVLGAGSSLADFSKRLVQILQQIRKNIEVRDVTFAEEFNQFCQQLREQVNAQEPTWARLRMEIRTHKETEWDGSLTLSAKGLNSRAKMLSRACDEFITQYDAFCKHYKNFTAAKLNVWLLTSCQTDIANLTGKILFLAREIAQKTERNRKPYACR